MEHLMDYGQWEEKEHPKPSRGMRLLRPPCADLKVQPGHHSESFYVTTIKRVFLFINLSRTSVAHPKLTDCAILWWNTTDETTLAKLHRACMDICLEVGFTEVWDQCGLKALSAPIYWQEMLGDNSRFLKKCRAHGSGGGNLA
ncbi:MAG: hypothetical protein NT154_28455 [Verrucomicrobia bacterium]|nr:hypothetical protein [Verrucomicrobiota bacterium]